MPSKSKAQQRFMGMVHAYNKGELKGSEVSKQVKDVAKSMKKKDTKDFAKTKHKGLPNKVKQEIIQKLRGMIRKELKEAATKKDFVVEGVRAIKAFGKVHKARNEFLERYAKLKKQLNTLKTESPNNEFLRLEKQLYKFETAFIEESSKLLGSVAKIAKSNLTESKLWKENSDKAVKDMIKKRYVKKGQREKDRVKGIGKWLDDRAHKISAKYNDNWIRRIKMGRGGQVQDWWGDTMSMIKVRLRESVNEDLYYGYYKNKQVKVNAKSDKDAKKQIISKLKIPKGDLNRASMINHTKNQFKLESLNEAGMELRKLEDAIKMFQKKIKKQGRVTNARDEKHLKNLIKVYKQMGGRKIKESVNEEVTKGKGVQKIFDIHKNGYGKLGGRMVDSLSAGLFVQLYDKAPDNIKEKMNKMNEKRLYIVIGKMWDKFGKNVRLS